MTSKNSGRGASGKFMAIYPSNEEHFTAIIQALDQATAGIAGPYILSDRRYRDNKVLFYRYGGFAPSCTVLVATLREPRPGVYVMGSG